LNPARANFQPARPSRSRRIPTSPSATAQAAMEFRSYYSGKTVIRATSPGLKDATITITTLGEPKYSSRAKRRR
jgi:hypothetical protein